MPVIRLVLTSIGAISLLCILCPRIFSWESHPEFQSLSEAEESRLENPIDIESEYYSDVLTYQKPASWEYYWLAHESALDFTTGSISAQEFLMDNRLKIRPMLTETLQFRFTHFEERTLERDSVHNILELILWPKWWTPVLGVGIYGEPSLNKRENDTGVAFFIRPHERHEIRVFNTWVDVTRQKRNNRGDRYIEPRLPFARGLVGRLWSNPTGKRPGEYFEYAVRYETQTQWSFGTESYDYRYWKFLAQTSLYKWMTPKTAFHLKLQWDRKLEARNATEPSTASAAVSFERWRTDRFLAKTQITLPRVGPSKRWEWTMGIQYDYRYWLTDGNTIKHHNAIPYIWWRLPAFSRNGPNDSWDLGYDFSWHRAMGAAHLRNPGDPDSAVDHRFNLAYAFVFQRDAELRLMLTADLDKFGTRRSFQGGNGQLRVYF